MASQAGLKSRSPASGSEVLFKGIVVVSVEKHHQQVVGLSDRADGKIELDQQSSIHEKGTGRSFWKHSPWEVCGRSYLQALGVSCSFTQTNKFKMNLVTFWPSVLQFWSAYLLSASSPWISRVEKKSSRTSWLERNKPARPKNQKWVLCLNRPPLANRGNTNPLKYDWKSSTLPVLTWLSRNRSYQKKVLGMIYQLINTYIYIRLQIKL